MIVAAAESRQLSKTAPVVDSGLVEGGVVGGWSVNLGGVTVCGTIQGHHTELTMDGPNGRWLRVYKGWLKATVLCLPT
jgi:hypothetical protein